MTWWDHRGTTEWVQYEFEAPRQVSAVRVYWFDDRAGGGHCALPATWQLLYRTANNKWVPVQNATQYGVDADQFNKVTFSAVSTTALRLQVQLRPDFSAGILEWEVAESAAEGQADLGSASAMRCRAEDAWLRSVRA